MREIKFRGKSVDTGEWVHGSLIRKVFYRIPGPDEEGNNEIIYILDPDYDNRFDSWEETELLIHEVEPGSVGQYTGLKDKNGVGIYEGDIVKVFSKYHGLLLIEQVTWNTGDNNYPAFDLYDYDGYGVNSFSSILHSDDEEMEVIGNAYENPHLLTKE